MTGGETLTVFRGGADKYGNPHKSEHGTVTGIFAWGPGKSTNKYTSSQGFRGESNSLTAQLYVPRGSDLKDKDRIRRANGQEYAVVGAAAWDQGHPFDGFDFGWMVFQVEGMNG